MSTGETSVRETSKASLRFQKPSWRQPVTAAALAATALGIGLFGYQAATAAPQYPLDIVVDEPLENDLGVGITAESIQAAAEGHYVYEPFTFRVVSRELDFSEYMSGDVEDADVILSIALNRQDADDLEDWEMAEAEEFYLGRAVENTVAFADPDIPLGDRREVESAFANNLTLGHGPNAVVGAALTAGDLQFSGSVRTPALWVPLTMLPVVAAIALMWFWQRDRRRYRYTLDRFSAAKLTLARVVLELDALEVRYLSARAALQDSDSDSSAQDQALQKDWEDIEHSSLQLARIEQELEKLFAGRATGANTDDTLLDYAPDSPQLDITPPHPGGTRALTHFELEAAALKERADALAAASELRAGHTGSPSVLDRLALPLIQAIDELIRRNREAPGIADLLAPHRQSLLALSTEAQDASAADSSGTDDDALAQQLVAEHADLLHRWGQSEEQLIKDLHQWRADHPSAQSAELEARAAQRVKTRIRALTSGEHESFEALRRTLGLGYGPGSGPLHAAEHTLELLDARHRQRTAPSAIPAEEETSWWLQGSTLGVVVPLVLALGAGVIAAGQVETNTQYGKVLEGDQELASIEVLGDISSVIELADPLSSQEDLTQADTVQLDYLRDRMQRRFEFSGEGLLPEPIDLLAMILEVDQYAEYELELGDNWDHIHFDYFDMMEVHHRIKQEAAEHNPAILDSETGEIAEGQAILPVWVMEDGRYGLSGMLTGDISTGVDSRLGRYDFQYTRARLNGDQETMMLGDRIYNDLGNLGMAMEYNHQESQQVSGTHVFWLTAVAAWGGLQMLVIIGTAMLDRAGRRFGALGARRQLSSLREKLNTLALGLDLSRLDMVAVLGGDSATGGGAEEADQRLYEAGLVTALRQVQALERMPARKMSGEDWMQRVQDVEAIIDNLAARDRETAQRAEELLTSQRGL